MGMDKLKAEIVQEVGAAKALTYMNPSRKDEQNEKRLCKAYFHLIPRKKPYEYGERFKTVSIFPTET